VATNVYMEALSPTMEEGRVAKWHKREGDAVKAGDTLAEVETDKAVMDLVARADGVLRQVAVAEGQTVPVGSVVAVIAAPGETVAAGGGRGKGEEGRVESPKAVSASAPSPVPRPSSAVVADATRVKASPLAKRIAKERGVDLQAVTGSGPGGRVVIRDLQATAATPTPVPRPASPVPASAGTPYTDVPLTQIRKTIAKRLATSLGPIPHFFLTSEVDMERAAEAREALNQQLGDQARSRSTTSSSRPPGWRSASIEPVTPGSRRITSATGTRCTSAWRWRWRTDSSRR